MMYDVCDIQYMSNGNFDLKYIPVLGTWANWAMEEFYFIRTY